MMIQLKKEVIDYFGESVEDFLDSIASMVSSVTQISIMLNMKEGECADSLQKLVIPELFNWINETGYKILTEENNIPFFMQQAVVMSKDFTQLKASSFIIPSDRVLH